MDSEDDDRHSGGINRPMASRSSLTSHRLLISSAGLKKMAFLSEINSMPKGFLTAKVLLTHIGIFH